MLKPALVPINVGCTNYSGGGYLCSCLTGQNEQYVCALENSSENIDLKQLIVDAANHFSVESPFTENGREALHNLLYTNGPLRLGTTVLSSGNLEKIKNLMVTTPTKQFYVCGTFDCPMPANHMSNGILMCPTHLSTTRGSSNCEYSKIQVGISCRQTCPSIIYLIFYIQNVVSRFLWTIKRAELFSKVNRRHKLDCQSPAQWMRMISFLYCRGMTGITFHSDDLTLKAHLAKDFEISYKSSYETVLKYLLVIFWFCQLCIPFDAFLILENRSNSQTVCHPCIGMQCTSSVLQPAIDSRFCRVHTELIKQQKLRINFDLIGQSIEYGCLSNVRGTLDELVAQFEQLYDHSNDELSLCMRIEG